MNSESYLGFIKRAPHLLLQHTYFRQPINIEWIFPVIYSGLVDKDGSINVGEHMYVERCYFHSMKNKQLSDGTLIKPGQLMGEIVLDRRLKPLKRDTSLPRYALEFYRSVLESFRQLAYLCNEDDPRLSGVDVFYGVSHLVGPSARELGFDVFSLKDPARILLSQLCGRMILIKNTSEHKDAWRLQKNFRSPREVFISRTRLINTYNQS